MQNWRTKTALTVPEAAEILGLSRNSAYELTARGDLPSVRLGRRVVVPVLALRRLLGESDAAGSPEAA